MSNGKEPSGEEMIVGLLEYIAALAKYLEVTAKWELETGTRVDDYAKAFSSKQFLDFLKAKVGVDGVAKLAVLLLKFASLPPNVFNAPAEQKIAIAQDLRSLIEDMKGVMDAFDEAARRDRIDNK